MIPEEDEDRMKSESGNFFHLGESQTRDLGSGTSMSNYYGEGIIQSNEEESITKNKENTLKKSVSLYISKVQKPADLLKDLKLIINSNNVNADNNTKNLNDLEAKRTRSASGNSVVMPSIHRTSKKANSESPIANDPQKKKIRKASPNLICNGNSNQISQRKGSSRHETKEGTYDGNLATQNSNNTIAHNFQTTKGRIYFNRSGITKILPSEKGTNKAKIDRNFFNNNNPSLKSNTPKDNLPLPIIDSKRKNSSENFVFNNIASIFENADDFKEDPIIKKKLDDIIQNISDIRNVLNQKTKSRMKVTSAPTRLDERGGGKNNFIKDVLKMEKCVSPQFTDISKKNVINNKNGANGILPQSSQKQNSIMKLTETKFMKEPIKIMRK